MALKTLQCCGDTSLLEQRGASRAIHTLDNPKNYTRFLGGLSAIHLMHRHGAQGCVQAMVVAVVIPVMFVLRLLKNAIKILKLIVCKQNFHLITIIVKHTAIHVTLIVAWPEPKLLWSIGSLEYQILPGS